MLPHVAIVSVVSVVAVASLVRVVAVAAIVRLVRVVSVVAVVSVVSVVSVVAVVCVVAAVSVAVVGVVSVSSYSKCSISKQVVNRFICMTVTFDSVADFASTSFSSEMYYLMPVRRTLLHRRLNVQRCLKVKNVLRVFVEQ